MRRAIVPWAITASLRAWPAKDVVRFVEFDFREEPERAPIDTQDGHRKILHLANRAQDCAVAPDHQHEVDRVLGIHGLAFPCAGDIVDAGGIHGDFALERAKDLQDARDCFILVVEAGFHGEADLRETTHGASVQAYRHPWTPERNRSTVRFQLKVLACCGPNVRRRARRESSVRRVCSPRLRSALSSGSAKRAASPATSDRLPRLLVSTGTPRCRASRTGMPNPS